MNPNQNRLTIPMLLNITLLIILMVAFRAEILATTARLSLHFFENPRLESLLGDYYQNAALLNHHLADHFYTNALQNNKAELSNATSKQKAAIQYRIGHLYFCGLGVVQNSKEAKQWFEEAQKSFKQAASEGQFLSPAFEQGIKQALAITSQPTSIHSGNQIASFCRLQSESAFVADIFNAY